MGCANDDFSQRQQKASSQCVYSPPMLETALFQGTQADRQVFGASLRHRSVFKILRAKEARSPRVFPGCLKGSKSWILDETARPEQSHSSVKWGTVGNVDEREMVFSGMDRWPDSEAHDEL